MAEQLIRNEQVVGSIPTISSKPANGEIKPFAVFFQRSDIQTNVTRTIAKLCKLLHCQPRDIMEYVEDEAETSINGNLLIVYVLPVGNRGDIYK